MPVVEFNVFLADTAVKWHPGVSKAKFWRCGLSLNFIQENHLVYQPQQSKSSGESKKSHQQPVSPQPEDDLDVGPVPAVSEVVCEEAPRVVFVLIGEHNAQAVVALWIRVAVVAPDEAEVQRSGGGHDGDVGERPATVVSGQGVNGFEEEGVVGNGPHSVVGDTGGDSATDPSRIREKRVEAAVASLGVVSCVYSLLRMGTYIIQVDVDSAKMV